MVSETVRNSPCLLKMWLLPQIPDGKTKTSMNSKCLATMSDRALSKSFQSYSIIGQQLQISATDRKEDLNNYLSLATTVIVHVLYWDKLIASQYCLLHVKPTVNTRNKLYSSGQWPLRLDCLSSLSPLHLATKKVLSHFLYSKIK